MSIVEKVFHYEENEISVIKCRDKIWFRGKDIAKALGYSIPRKAIREHVDPEDRSSLEHLSKGGPKRTPLKMSRKVQLSLTLTFTFTTFHKRKWFVLSNVALS